ncbi:MAG TPA: efflux RND transporter periplasmic adaptor subunit [Candidatus Binataceae bacterium]|nr:efflux RND transporter periplasmic adaptor subunit [Candidatus Binataceae bacterium]
MRLRIEILLAFIGLGAGMIGAYIYGLHVVAQAPAFNPPANPYAKGVYAEGMVEAYQNNGANINIFPNISGTIIDIPVREGEWVRKGTMLVHFDDSVQKAAVEAAKAQVAYARAQLKNVRDELAKDEASYRLDPKSISKYTLDDAINAVKVAAGNLQVNEKNYISGKALLAWYTIAAPGDGRILAIQAAVGSYVTANQGTYDTYTQGFDPIIVMGPSEDYLSVRCYIDEILIHRLKPGPEMDARMLIRGTNISVPLEYVRVQPYVSPKIELSNERTERVDVRVLPVIFRFARQKDLPVYPGLLVDVYIAEK